MIKKNKNKGFTILIAVVAASILLVVSMSLASIALRQQILAASGRDSQVAFYAADTGIECALYWDSVWGTFGDVTIVDANTTVARPTDWSATDLSKPFKCNVNTLSGGAARNGIVKLINLQTGVESLTQAQVPGGNIPVRFVIGNLSSGGACAIVTVRKNKGAPLDPSGTPIPPKNGVSYDVNKYYTTIDSRGYNTCNASLRRLERGILATY